MKFWNINLLNKDPKYRCFFILKNFEDGFLDYNSFRPLMKSKNGEEFLFSN